MDFLILSYSLSTIALWILSILLPFFYLTRVSVSLCTSIHCCFPHFFIVALCYELRSLSAWFHKFLQSCPDRFLQPDQVGSFTAVIWHERGGMVSPHPMWGCISGALGLLFWNSRKVSSLGEFHANMSPAVSSQARSSTREATAEWTLWLDMVPRWTTRSLESEGFLQKIMVHTAAGMYLRHCAPWP